MVGTTGQALVLLENREAELGSPERLLTAVEKLYLVSSTEYIFDEEEKEREGKIWGEGDFCT